MPFTIRSTLVACLCLVSAAKALPASYSVVDVDGGASIDATSLQPVTVFQTVTAPQTAKETTVLVTLVSSPATTSTSTSTESTTIAPSLPSSTKILPSSASSTVSSSTSLPASAITAPPALPSVTILLDPSTTTITTSSTLITTVIDDATITVVSTFTVTPSPSSTSYYDDGMWHTYYPIKPVQPAVATSAITALRRRAAATPEAKHFKVVSWEET